MTEILKPNEGIKFPLSEVLRRRAFDCLVAQPYDAVIPYAALAVAIGLDPQKDHRARRAVLRAGRMLLREHRKKLVNIRTKGYRIVMPGEQADVSQTEQRRAQRQLKRSLETVTFIAQETLTPRQIARIMTEQARVGLQLAMGRRLRRLKELPAKDQLRLPSANRLIELFSRPAKKKAS